MDKLTILDSSARGKRQLVWFKHILLSSIGEQGIALYELLLKNKNKIKDKTEEKRHGSSTKQREKTKYNQELTHIYSDR